MTDRRVHNENGQALTPPLSRVIAFMNQKGGVGKTTTVVNLASAIAAKGRSTLVIDLDPQAHASLHLGVDPEKVELSLYDLLLDPPDHNGAGGIAPDRVVQMVRENLGVIPAVTDLAAAESELAMLDERHGRLARALESLKRRFEFVLIDCPPSLGLLTLNGLAAAREVIVPMQAHFLALQGVGKLLETVQLVGRSVNPRLRVTGVVLCMHDEQSRHTREVVSDLEAFFERSRNEDVPWRGARVYRPAVRRNIKLAECPSFGQTIFEYEASCAGAEDYRQLAETLLTEWDRMLERRAGAEVVVTPAAKADTHA